MAQDSVVIADFNDPGDAQRLADVLDQAGLRPSVTGGGPQSVQEGTALSGRGRFQVRVPIEHEVAARKLAGK